MFYDIFSYFYVGYKAASPEGMILVSPLNCALVKLNRFFFSISKSPGVIIGKKVSLWLFDIFHFFIFFLSFYMENSDFLFFCDLSRINKRANRYLFEHANISKHVYEHSCLSVMVFFRITSKK